LLGMEGDSTFKAPIILLVWSATILKVWILDNR